MRRIIVSLLVGLMLTLPVYADVDYSILDGMSLEDLKDIHEETGKRIEALEKASEDTESSEEGTWEIRYYIDEFKQPTEDGYISTIDPIVGVFSNSATKDSKLYVYPLFDEDYCFKLIEYGHNVVTGYQSKGTKYTLTILEESGEKPNFSAMLYDGGDRIVIQKKDEFKAILERNNELNILVVEKDRPSTNYLFQMKDLNQYRELNEQLFG